MNVRATKTISTYRKTETIAAFLISVMLCAVTVLVCLPHLVKSQEKLHDQDRLNQPQTSNRKLTGKDVTELLKKASHDQNFEIPFWLRHCAESISHPDENRIVFSPSVEFSRKTELFEFTNQEARQSYGKINKVNLTGDREKDKVLLATDDSELCEFMYLLKGRKNAIYRKAALSKSLEAFIIFDELPHAYQLVLFSNQGRGLGGDLPIRFLERIPAGIDLRGGGYGPGLFAYCDVRWNPKARQLAVYGCNSEVLFWNTYSVSESLEVTKLRSFNSRDLCAVKK